MIDRQLLGLGIGFVLLLFLILRSRLSAFPSLLIGATVTGIIAGLPADQVVAEIAKGFGNTMMKIGIVIGLGIMLGKILEISGAAKTMAITFLKFFGKGREEAAMAGTGYVVSIAIFSDSGFIILYELAKSVAYYTRKSIVGLTFALVVGLSATHNMVPPTPGPLAVAGYFNVDVGTMILYGMLIALPMVGAGVLLAGWVGRKLYQIPDEQGHWTRDRSLMGKTLSSDIISKTEKGLPGALVSFIPLVVPILFILARTVTDAVSNGGDSSIIAHVILFLGTPYVAILTGIVLGLTLLTRRMERQEVTKRMGDALNSAGMIVFVTAGGGALGHIIRVTGIGESLGSVLINSPFPIILLPFVIATLLKIVQGSSTVAVLTSAAITAPIFATMDINPVLPALSACAGGATVSHLNDSIFWVFAKMNGLSETETLWAYTLPRTIEGLIGIVMILLLDIFL